MDSTNPAKKRKSTSDSDPPLPGNDAPSSVLSVNLPQADLNRLIDRRVVFAVEEKTLALSSRVAGLQRNEELLRRCESLERSFQVLKKEGNWAYTAPDVPRSYWTEQGRDEEYAGGAESLIERIKACTHDLRSAGGNVIAEVGVGSEAHVISEDDALHPHWEQLADAMQLSERIATLGFYRAQLNEHTLQMIEASVRQKGIAGFGLFSNQFRGSEGVQFTIDVLKNNSSVEEFDWEENTFHSTMDSCTLIDAVLHHPSISHLNLARSLNEGIISFTPVKRLFSGVGNDTLLTINLCDNGIIMNGDRCIPDFLSANPTLKRLNLAGNRLNKEDALNIAQALQYNTNLTDLNMEDNALKKKGKWNMYILSVFGISPSVLSKLDYLLKFDLNTVSKANHTCKITGIAPTDYFMNNSNDSAKLNRRKKLFMLIRKRHRNGCQISQLETEFSESSVGIMPHVLSFISMHESRNMKHYCLSVLFEMMRDWKTPEIYQFYPR
ncbi:hypothetical protein THAOC_36517 [Thalassiosira oceanica]|uniref:Uncharacterized protein n=1 Tax=Thalassiosira oceanica TaxID=159749 RepID=K0R024_THAOC|nr:hypothetical protein THAOC_36517 [Thalassiosira oceanica]|eukprot:EJK44910.1 hypothetical protein THAOC_36517 [Thalassiosira oceanica]